MTNTSVQLPLFEDWFDQLQDNPANRNEAQGEKSVINTPFTYVYGNNEIIIAKMEEELYLIDIMGIETKDASLWQTLAIDYVGVNRELIDGEPEYNFESVDIGSLSDIPGEFIVSYINEEYPDNITIGTTFDEWEQNVSFVIKINDDIRNEILSVFPNEELESVLTGQ